MLDGKVAVVTGASAGIGAATAHILASAGARVLLVARRQDRLKALQQEIGEAAQFMALDLSDPSSASARCVFYAMIVR